MINTKQLKRLTDEILKEFDLYSKSASNLLIGTFLAESRGGTYIRQISKGEFDINVHALGIGQMEYNTFDWLETKYMNLLEKHDLFYNYWFRDLEYNLKYSIIFTRLRYLAVSEPLPEANNLEELGKYWKKYYNTIDGAGEVEEFVKLYNRYAR
jgi:hypothetical protein